uniref:Indoleamine 2,3-dioxygenase n=1 Tax=Tolypocladium album TaxID=124418 RepID=M1VE33_TOLAL|nr:indoleamine 2,3-dioxygenase [Tolypocladium album]
MAKLLESFGITRNGFLPEGNPLEMLPDSYYEPWEAIAQNLPDFIQHGIREAVTRLPLLSTERLCSDEEWRRAYVVLAYLSHAYIWAGEKPEEILPPQISVPFLRVSKHLELPPVLTYAAADLWNFSCVGVDFTKLESLRTLCSFTGTETESWFVLISVAIEATAGGIITQILNALHHTHRKPMNYRVVTDAVEDLGHCIHSISELLDRMYERCDPMVFYHQVRPFLAGGKNMEAAGLPRGIFFDEGCGVGKWRQLRGGSNGQSSLIQLLDIALGIDHGTDAELAGARRSFHDEVRDYMPGPHRRFLSYANSLGSLRDIALLPCMTVEQHRLRCAYSVATKELGILRNKHLQIVAKYIILPSKRLWTEPRKGLASASVFSENNELTGTGGTSLLPFLKMARDKTTLASHLG